MPLKAGAPYLTGQQWGPRIDKWNAGVCEIGDIARHDDFAVNRRRRCDQPVDHTARALRSQAAPFERDAITA